MYSQDYDERMPGGQTIAGDTTSQWYNAIFPYTRNRQIMFCPDRADRGPGYGMNWEASGLAIGSFWDPAMQTATERYYIVDAATGEVVLHAMSNEAYTNEQYSEILAEAGFAKIEFFPSLIGVKDESQSSNLVIVARRPHA